MNDQAFNDYLNNVRANATNEVQPPVQPVSQAPAQQPQQGSGGNWLTHLLPTAGSLGGGAGGAAIGTALLPGIGTIAGGILGAALGGGGAKAAENATEGKSIGNGVGTAAIEGGVGQAAGGVAGKVLGKGAELLASRASGITKAATDTAEAAAKSKAGIDEANAIRNNYGAISQKLQGDDHLALGSNQKLLKTLDYDATDPYQMAKAAEAGYHPTDLSLNQVYDEALQGAKPVQASDIHSLFNGGAEATVPGLTKEELSSLKAAGISPEIAAKGTILPGSGTPAAPSDLSGVDPVSPLGKVLSDFGDKTKGLYGQGSGLSLPDNIPATDVRKLQQAVGKEMRTQQTLINNAANNGVSNVEAETAHNNLSKIYDNLGSKIKTPEVDKAVANRVTTPEERASLVEKFGETHGNHIADTIDNAKGANDILAPMKSYTQMGQASDMAVNDIENATATNRAVARAKVDINGDGTADVAPPDTNVPGLASDIHNAHGTVGKALALGKHASNSPGILNTLSRMGTLLAKGAPATGVVAATAPNLGASPVAGAPQNGTMGAVMQPQQQNPLDQLYQTLLQNYQVGGGITPNDASAAGTLATLTPQVQKQNLASTELSAIPGAFANAGGAQGAGGILSHIAGLIPGTAAHTYQQQQAGAAQALAAQLGISPQAAMGLLPQLMQNQQTAGQSQGVLGQLTGQLAYQ